MQILLRGPWEQQGATWLKPFPYQAYLLLRGPVSPGQEVGRTRFPCFPEEIDL